MIGEGGFGDVYFEKVGGINCAVKTIVFTVQCYEKGRSI